jgi:hypothetical protein
MDVVNKIQLKDTINDNNLCQICYTSITIDNLACTTCNKSSCTTCCNNLESRNFSISKKYKNTNNTIVDHSDGSINIEWDCSFCRAPNNRFIEDFTKDEVIRLILVDYVTLFHEMNIKEELEKQFKYIYYTKLQLHNTILRYKNVDPTIKKLILINKDLQVTNNDLIETLMFKETQIQQKVNNDILISELQKHILKLQQTHIEDFNSYASKNNLIYEQLNIIKTQNDQLLNTIASLKDNNSTLKTENDTIKHHYFQLIDKIRCKLPTSIKLRKCDRTEYTIILDEYYNKHIQPSQPYVIT